MSRVNRRPLGRTVGAQRGVLIIPVAPLGAGTDQFIFAADRAYRLIGFSAVCTSTAGGTVMLRKCNGTSQGPAAGTTMLNSAVTFSANDAADGDLVTTEATLRLAPGELLAADITGTAPTNPLYMIHLIPIENELINLID